MRKEIGIIGNGCLAIHITHYLKLLNVPFKQWTRESKAPLQSFSDECDIILIMISDDQIQDFITDNNLSLKNCYHFSGSQSVSGAISCHPLMTFSKELYTLEFYQSVPFVCEAGGEKLKSDIPELINKFTTIKSEDKALYHALCVMSGNFTTILWQKFFTEMQSLTDLSLSELTPYLDAITSNLKRDFQTALTGPFARKDIKTINDNINSLSGDKFQQIYESFAGALLTEKEERK